MRTALALGVTVACFTTLASLTTQSPAEAQVAYRVIVHPNNPTVAVDRKFLAQAFLKKTTQWRHGDVMRPVDLGPDSPVRRKFAEDVLNRSVSAVKSYWQQIIFSGRGVPPPELDSEEEVVRYVLRYPGAVGYVSGSANTGGAKVIAVR